MKGPEAVSRRSGPETELFRRKVIGDPCLGCQQWDRKETHAKTLKKTPVLGFCSQRLPNFESGVLKKAGLGGTTEEMGDAGESACGEGRASPALRVTGGNGTEWRRMTSLSGLLKLKG